MKTILFGRLYAAILMICFWASARANTFAQDSKAEAILNAFSEKHAKMTAFRADFVLTMRSEVEKINETIKGNITIKGEKFRLKMEDGQEIFNNKSTVWNYIKGGKNQRDEITVSNYDPDTDDLNLSNIYNLYKKGFKYYFMEEQKIDGEMYDVIDLTPEDKSREYFKIRLTISKRTRDLRTCQIFEKTGKRTVITVTNIVPNVRVDDNYFTASRAQYPNAEWIDLR